MGNSISDGIRDANNKYHGISSLEYSKLREDTWVLGTKYSKLGSHYAKRHDRNSALQISEARLAHSHHVQSILWFSYRKGFLPLPLPLNTADSTVATATAAEAFANGLGLGGLGLGFRVGSMIEEATGAATHKSSSSQSSGRSSLGLRSDTGWGCMLRTVGASLF